MSDARNLAGAALTERVVASLGSTASPRLREVLEALVRHLHGFATEVRLTEAEWFAAVDYLTRTGQTCDDERQEYVLLSDVLGLSMLVVGLNHDDDGSTAATESTVFGPFFVEGAPRIADGGDLAAGAPGTPCHVSGRVLDPAGSPLPGARVDVWQADDEGLYDVQYAGLDAPRGRGVLETDAAGRFRFWTVLPEPYPIPTDGPVGELLRATGRSEMRPAHIHFMVHAEGYERLITHVFRAGDPYLDTDAVFVEHPAGVAADGSVRDTPYHALAYDFVLRAARA